MKKILVLGDSHTGAYFLAANKLCNKFLMKDKFLMKKDTGDYVLEFAGATGPKFKHLLVSRSGRLVLPREIREGPFVHGALRTGCVDTKEFSALVYVRGHSPLSLANYYIPRRQMPMLSNSLLKCIIKSTQSQDKIFAKVAPHFKEIYRLFAPLRHRNGMNKNLCSNLDAKKAEFIQRRVSLLVDAENSLEEFTTVLQPLETLDSQFLGTKDEFMRLDSETRVRGGTLKQHPTDYVHANQAYGEIMLSLLDRKIRSSASS